MRRSRLFLAIVLLGALGFGWLLPSACGQQVAKRLILKDGSYQLATKWEVNGDRVRYMSAERNDWEELPNSLVDWAATEKFEKDRAAGKPDPEAVELDKELDAERAAEIAKTPQVAPGLHLPDDGLVMLFDTFQSQPQLVELQQSGGEINRNTKGNILRAAIKVANRTQTIELDGAHATIQAHATLPAIYVNLSSDQNPAAVSRLEQPQQPEIPEQPWDRFHIVRMQLKKDRRIVGDIKINPLGKVSEEQKLVPTTSQQLTGGWIKVTPTVALEPGEYALVELLGKDGMNRYVWDFGLNPAAAANAGAVKADAPDSQAQPTQPKDAK